MGAHTSAGGRKQWNSAETQNLVHTKCDQVQDGDECSRKPQGTEVRTRGVIQRGSTACRKFRHTNLPCCIPLQLSSSPKGGESIGLKNVNGLMCVYATV